MDKLAMRLLLLLWLALPGCGSGLRDYSGAGLTATGQVSGNYSGTWSAIVSGTHLTQTSFSMTLFQAAGTSAFNGVWLATGGGSAVPLCGSVTGTSSADGLTLTATFTAPAAQTAYSGTFNGTFASSGGLVSGKVAGTGTGGKTLTSFFNLTVEQPAMASPFSGYYPGTWAGTINAVPIADTTFVMALYQSDSTANGVWVASGGGAPMCGAVTGAVSGTSLAATLIFAPNQAIYAGQATGTMSLASSAMVGEVTGTGSVGGALDATLSLAAGP